MTQLTKQLIAVAGLIIIAFFLINRVFPEKKDVEPVRKQSVQIEKDTKNTNKGVITDDEVQDIRPIGDIPVIRMQSDKQQTDANTGISGTIYQIEPTEYREVKPDSEEAKQIAESVEPEPKEDIGIGTQPPEIIGCDLDHLEELSIMYFWLSFECVNNEWIDSEFNRS